MQSAYLFETGTELLPEADVSEESDAVNFMKKYGKQYVYSVTENGAIGYSTTGRALLDLNFRVSSLRNYKEIDIARAFVKAYYESPKYAVKWMFFLRDVLGGLGERRSFRVCLKYLAFSHTDIARAVMPLVPEYGRYDDLLVYLDTPLCDEVCRLMKHQLDQDLKEMEQDRSVSLLAKWLPSENASSARTRQRARLLADKFHMAPREYRKALSRLRAYSNVVEVKISASEWSEVEYDKVPAKANLKYDAAFARHDKDRRIRYLLDTYTGENKINSKGLMPHEIVHRIVNLKNWKESLKDDLLGELLWREIVSNGFENEWGLEDAIVVADGSGSMFSRVSRQSDITAIEICNALAIYFSEQLKGAFHNKAITFSNRPQFIELDRGGTLKEKLEIMFAYDEISNTNIEAVFDLLLAMAIDEQVSDEELPKQVLILSDMEFDQATVNWNVWDRNERDMVNKADKVQPLLKEIEKRFEKHGYHMPRLIFWNLCGRTNTIPMVANGNGLCLLSGFSQNAMKIAAGRERKDPYTSLLEVLDDKRYDAVEKALERYYEMD